VPAVSDQRDELLSALREQAERRRVARETASDAMTEIAKLLPLAIEAGIRKSEIARETGLSRVTIDGALRRREEADPE
jgi:hypothetical protein